MDFAGPIPFRNQTENYYILVSVYRYSSFPTLQVYKNCDATERQQQQKKRTQQKLKVNTEKQQTRLKLSPQTRKKHTMLQQKTRSKSDGKQKTPQTQWDIPVEIKSSCSTADKTPYGETKQVVHPHRRERTNTISHRRSNHTHIRFHSKQPSQNLHLRKQIWLTPLIKIIRDKDCDSLKKANKYFKSLREELAVTESGCMLYDNKLVIPRNLKQLVIGAIQQTHLGQAGMISLQNLVWFSCIHRSLTSKPQACEECTKQGKNLKPILPKQNLVNFHTLAEPNEELQMNFAGSIPFRNH